MGLGIEMKRLFQVMRVSIHVKGKKTPPNANKAIIIERRFKRFGYVAK